MNRSDRSVLDDALDIGNQGCIWMAIISVVFIICSFVYDDIRSILISVPTLVISCYLLYTDRKPHISIFFVFFLMLTLVLVQFSNYFSSKYDFLSIVADLVLGMFLSFVGFILLFSLTRKIPGFDRSNPFTATFIGVNTAVSLAIIISLAEFGIKALVNEVTNDSMYEFFQQTFTGIVGSLIVGILFYLNRRFGLFSTVMGTLVYIVGKTDMNQDELKECIMKDIEAGESDRVEYKSTLRTNLNTKAVDPRMEKAVLKTIVAFLNGSGGVLLIGVEDNGNIRGIDIEAFDKSLDKFNLHLNNLIVKQIGSEYIPFITWKSAEFEVEVEKEVDGKIVKEIEKRIVVRVFCYPSTKPVFLKDGTTTIFYVRSGPSSIDVHGTNMLYYATHRYGKKIGKKKPKVEDLEKEVKDNDPEFQ